MSNISYLIQESRNYWQDVFAYLFAFIAAKLFVMVFSIYKRLRLYQINIFLSKLLTVERDWKLLIQIFNNMKQFLDQFEIYLTINVILKNIPLILHSFPCIFCMIIIMT